MKYPRVTVISLPDSSFLINVPLISKEMRDFKRELSGLFQERGESPKKIKKNDKIFLSVFTQLNKEEIETVSNQIVRNILKRRKKWEG
jgi:hypothetical protein